jgi:hypothetical protein
MRDYHGASPLCATCQSWKGPRRADRRAGRVRTEGHATMGYCRSPVSWWAGRARQGDSECRFWQQWEPMRGAAGLARSDLVKLGSRMPSHESPTPPE